MVSEELRKIINCGTCSERSCDGMSCLAGLVQSLRDKRDQLDAALSAARIEAVREFAEFCVEGRGLWYRTHLKSLLARWLAEKEG